MYHQTARPAQALADEGSELSLPFGVNVPGTIVLVRFIRWANGKVKAFRDLSGERVKITIVLAKASAERASRLPAFLDPSGFGIDIAQAWSARSIQKRCSHEGHFASSASAATGTGLSQWVQRTVMVAAVTFRSRFRSAALQTPLARHPTLVNLFIRKTPTTGKV